MARVDESRIKADAELAGRPGLALSSLGAFHEGAHASIITSRLMPTLFVALLIQL
ncbi:hypothetical protein G3545_25805 [Starkeya sp. ORNL1]|uniref:hypothetical protein n=1 Tax=Starkeya sp. ORNL1 TaxID=2709380 RepID=UPI0014643248|nr:hypothetical protein [Starkeya sp. ORNL1]QJP16753.1 hypothetical protein G3545_25805 [Starkeya sp. ORNL1]